MKRINLQKLVEKKPQLQRMYEAVEKNKSRIMPLFARPIFTIQDILQDSPDTKSADIKKASSRYQIHPKK